MFSRVIARSDYIAPYFNITSSPFLIVLFYNKLYFFLFRLLSRDRIFAIYDRPSCYILPIHHLIHRPYIYISIRQPFSLALNLHLVRLPNLVTISTHPIPINPFQQRSAVHIGFVDPGRTTSFPLTGSGYVCLIAHKRSCARSYVLNSSPLRINRHPTRSTKRIPVEYSSKVT